MTLVQLECFIAVAQYNNFTEAAKHLNVVQSVVSHHVAELEKELNVRLFKRDRRAVTLTFTGGMLLERAYQIVALTRDVKNLADKSKEGISGELRIGYPFAELVSSLKEGFLAFHKKYPNIHIMYDSYEAVDMSDKVSKNQLDIGFMRYNSLVNHKQVNWKSVYKESLCIVVNAEHPLSQRKTAHIQELEGEELLLIGRQYDAGWYDMALDVCLKENYIPRLNDRVSHISTTMMMVEMGLGFTILPKCWKDSVNDKFVFLDLEGEHYHELGVAWHVDESNPCKLLFLKEMGFID